MSLPPSCFCTGPYWYGLTFIRSSWLDRDMPSSPTWLRTIAYRVELGSVVYVLVARRAVIREIGTGLDLTIFSKPL